MTSVETIIDKTKDLEIEDEETAAMFADLKKKKKKKSKTTEKKIEEDSQAKEKEENMIQEELDHETFDLKKKKKKSKKIDLEELDEEKESSDQYEDGDNIFHADEEDEENEEEAWLNSNRDYTYQELLARVFKIIRHKNPELAGGKRRYTIAPPQILREGNKKTIFANLSSICERLKRHPDHVMQYIFAEFGTSGSIDASGRLTIKGRFQQKQIQNILRRYITEYVTCKTCKALDTTLSKENRIFFIKCESCGSTRSVSAIKTGFKAQTEKRAAQRNRIVA